MEGWTGRQQRHLGAEGEELEALEAALGSGTRHFLGWAPIQFCIRVAVDPEAQYRQFVSAPRNVVKQQGEQGGQKEEVGDG